MKSGRENFCARWVPTVLFFVCCNGFTEARAETLGASLTLGLSPYQYGVGGEFTASNVQGLQLAASPLWSGNTFETFCVEWSEEFYPGHQYFARVNTAVNFDGHPAENYIPKPLTAQAAYLYSQFWNGTLSNYFTACNRRESAHQLQEALWSLQSEPVDADYRPALGSKAQVWINQANDAVAHGSWGNSIHNVRVINLFADRAGSFESRAQDQLVVVAPLPSTVQVAFPMIGLTALLFGYGKVRLRASKPG